MLILSISIISILVSFAANVQPKEHYCYGKNTPFFKNKRRNNTPLSISRHGYTR